MYEEYTPDRTKVMMFRYYFLPCTDTIVGVNKYTLDKEEPVEVLSIDNAKTIESQVRGIVARDTCLLAIPLVNWANQQWLQSRVDLLHSSLAVL